MSLRNEMYGGVLASLPSDTNARAGYEELVDLWEEIGERNIHPTADQFNAWKNGVHMLLTLREKTFFQEPIEPGLAGYPELIQAKMTGRLSKILMDRHGFKVAKDKGGLG
jgi:hypothetical protein